MKTKLRICLIIVLMGYVALITHFLTLEYATRTHAVGCKIMLPGIPGYFCQKLDDRGLIVYENKEYRIYIK
jgi:hypothetical protein